MVAKIICDTITNANNAGTPNMSLDASGNVTFGNGFTVTGNQTFSGQTFFPDGSAAAPSISHTSDTNCGFYFGTDTIYASTSGTNALTIDASQNIGIGVNSVPTNFRIKALGITGSNTGPASSGTTQSASAMIRLQAGGGFTGTLDIGQGGGTGSWLQSCDTTNLATNYPLLLNPNGGNVGIGTNAPSQKLHVYAGAGGGIPVVMCQGYTSSAGGSGKAVLDIDVNGNGGFAFVNDSTSGTRTLLFQANSGYGSSDTTLMTLSNAGNLTINTADAGIVFNKSGALTNSTLNDYEFGTYTPQAFLGATGQTVGNPAGHYVKIGRNVFVSLQLSSITKSGTGLLLVSLPFTAAGVPPYGGGSVRWAGITSAGLIIPLTYGSNSSYVTFQSYGTTGFAGDITDSAISATYDLYTVFFTYYAAS